MSPFYSPWGSSCGLLMRLLAKMHSACLPLPCALGLALLDGRPGALPNGLLSPWLPACGLDERMVVIRWCCGSPLSLGSPGAVQPGTGCPWACTWIHDGPGWAGTSGGP